MNDIIEELKARYIYIKEKQGVLNEETVKINLIRDVLLSRLGFDLLECTYEKSCQAGYADIVVRVNQNNLFFVETKTGVKEELTDTDIGQLARYIQSHGMEWGLLTNGKEYVLINKSITPRENFIGNSGKELGNR